MAVTVTMTEKVTVIMMETAVVADIATTMAGDMVMKNVKTVVAIAAAVIND